MSRQVLADRRCQHEGADAVLVRRGDTDAGAIYIKVSRLDGTAALFGPAPAGMEEAREERRWLPCLGSQSASGPPSEADADAYLARQIEFDPGHLDRVGGGPPGPPFPRGLARRLTPGGRLAAH